MIATREQLIAGGKPRSEVIPFPELGDGIELRIRGYSFGEVLKIREAATVRDQDGQFVRFIDRNNMMLSVVAAVEEPRLTEQDVVLLEEMSDGIISKILGEADRLSGRSVDAFEQLKQMHRNNPEFRRIYEVCRKEYKRLPSEMGDITAEEFQTALAEIEVEQEERIAKALAGKQESDDIDD